MSEKKIVNLIEQLKKPFDPKYIDWRISRIYAEKRKATVVAYIDARAIMDRLDEVIGAENWQDDYEITKDGILCRLKLKINGEWIQKTDGAPPTDYESFKGGISDAFKRAAVKWGIGRYLYNLPEIWVNLTETRPEALSEKVKYVHDKKTNFRGYYVVPDLPEFALPSVKKVKVTVEKGKPTIVEPEGLKKKITDAQRRKLFVLMKSALSAIIEATDITDGEVEWALKKLIDLKNASRQKASTLIEHLSAVVKGLDPDNKNPEYKAAAERFIKWYNGLQIEE